MKFSAGGVKPVEKPVHESDGSGKMKFSSGGTKSPAQPEHKPEGSAVMRFSSGGVTPSEKPLGKADGSASTHLQPVRRTQFVPQSHANLPKPKVFNEPQHVKLKPHNAQYIQKQYVKHKVAPVKTLKSGERTGMHHAMKVTPKPEQREHAYRIAHGERAKFRAEKAEYSPSDYDIRVVKNVRVDPGTYYVRRDIFYSAYGFAPPTYIYGWNSHYGVWDSQFLSFALMQSLDAQYAALFYNHQYDEDLIQWREQVEIAAAENADLKARLDMLDEQMQEMQKAGIPVDQTYVPEDAQDIAFAGEAIDMIAEQQAGEGSNN